MNSEILSQYNDLGYRIIKKAIEEGEVDNVLHGSDLKLDEEAISNYFGKLKEGNFLVEDPDNYCIESDMLENTYKVGKRGEQEFEDWNRTPQEVLDEAYENLDQD